MTLERSVKGKKAKSVFFHQFNDIDIYVEDSSVGSKKLYSTMFARALESTYLIHSVFPLGEKRSVIAQCAADQDDGGRLRLYVIDGDLSLLTDTNPKGLKRLMVLNRYSIENYLIDEAAIMSVLDEEDIERSLSDIKKSFAFLDWVNANETDLFELFVFYAVASEVIPSCPTVSFSVRNLVCSPMGLIDNEKLRDRKQEIERHLLKVVSQEVLCSKVKSIIAYVEGCGRRRLAYVSGKDYLMPLILMRMRRIVKLRADNDVIKQRLAMQCDVSELTMAREIIC